MPLFVSNRAYPFIISFVSPIIDIAPPKCRAAFSVNAILDDPSNVSIIILFSHAKIPPPRAYAL